MRGGSAAPARTRARRRSPPPTLLDREFAPNHICIYSLASNVMSFVCVLVVTFAAARCNVRPDSMQDAPGVVNVTG
jgi:hypothetical protein